MATIQKLELSIKHNFNQFAERFMSIMDRGRDRGLGNVSKELKDQLILTTAKLMAYKKSAFLTDLLVEMGGPDHVPHEIDEQMTAELNKLDDLMTLETSSLPDKGNGSEGSWQREG